ncbi:MAG: PIG-L family deacetylase [Candidatus Omnitrophica bacterium]|nr:PIG-L family deacetylase [Candidatus Omnitrophota bacterium]MDD5660343.1 PIG-L family deacetylase [Candidatus Omnitrophota bacterium]
MSVLIVAAHPDDEILGCGGFISKMQKRGVNCFSLILTDGATGRYKPAKKKALAKYALAANKVIGASNVFFEDFPNQKLDEVSITSIIKAIERYIKRLGVDCVFTHHGRDLNIDHRIIYDATITACRPLPGQQVKTLYTYMVASSTEWNRYEKDDIFVPNVFLDISEEIETKIRAMKCYKTECRLYPHPRSSKAIRAYAHYQGLTVGLEYAESFRLIRDMRG